MPLYVLEPSPVVASSSKWQGSLCLGNAFRNWENRLLTLFDCLVSAGKDIQADTSRMSDWPQYFPTKRKLIYCSRTVPEIEKALTELKRLMEYRIQAAETEEQKETERSFTGLGLTSRRNLCLHPDVSKEKKGNVVDAKCRDLTCASACEKGRANPGSVPLCDWHEVLAMTYYSYKV
jgi:hypothetical protein